MTILAIDYLSLFSPLTFSHFADLLHSTCPQAVLVFIAEAGAATGLVLQLYAVYFKERPWLYCGVEERFTDCCKSHCFHASVSDSIFKCAFLQKTTFSWQIRCSWAVKLLFHITKINIQRKLLREIDILHDHTVVGSLSVGHNEMREQIVKVGVQPTSDYTHSICWSEQISSRSSDRHGAQVGSPSPKKNKYLGDRLLSYSCGGSILVVEVCDESHHQQAQLLLMKPSCIQTNVTDTQYIVCGFYNVNPSHNCLFTLVMTKSWAKIRFCLGAVFRAHPLCGFYLFASLALNTRERIPHLRGMAN